MKIDDRTMLIETKRLASSFKRMCSLELFSLVGQIRVFYVYLSFAIRMRFYLPNK